MISTRTTARLVGVLYIVGTVAGGLSAALLTPIQNSQNELLEVSQQTDQVLAAALLILLMGFALAAIPLLLYPILKRHSEPLALGYVVFRGAIETTLYLVSSLVWLVLLHVGQEYAEAEGADASHLEAVGAVVLEINDVVGHVILALVFPVGALLFYYVLWDSRLVPRWLSGWGILAAFLYLAAALLVLFEIVNPLSTVQVALSIPMAIQEIALAIWLLVRGFDTDRIAAGGAGA
ncbi:hypothetical protein GCM10028857_15180 [Salinarchaeum chitinilyticum]